MTENAGIRVLMAPVHTWFGVLLGTVLFIIFWTGTVLCFDREIDRWMMPATRLSASTQAVSLDRLVVPMMTQYAKPGTSWSVDLPTEREPYLRTRFTESAGKSRTVDLDSRSGEVIPGQGTSGSKLIFLLHFALDLGWKNLGSWVVGFAGTGMIVLLASGLVIHRKMIADFFTFRPERQILRSSLDLHNVTGVIFLPFIALMTVSGLAISIWMYFPDAHVGVYGTSKEDLNAYYSDVFGVGFERDASNAIGRLSSLDAMQMEAKRLWNGEGPEAIRVVHFMDTSGYVEMDRSYANSVSRDRDKLVFDASSGKVVHRYEAPPIIAVQRYLIGMHFMQFDHWVLRWIFFASGLAGCVLIATGMVFWMESRRSKKGRDPAGTRIVEAISICSIAGLILSTVTYLVLNRALPEGEMLFGHDRASLERYSFYAVWLASLAAAFCRGGRAWRDHSWAIAALAVTACGLNWITTGDPLWRSVAEPRLWPVAAVDIALLIVAAIATMIGLRLAPASKLRSARYKVGNASEIRGVRQ